MSLDPFPIIVQEKEGCFVCLVENLSISETNGSLIEAYKRASQRKEEILHQFQASHLTPPIRSKVPSRTVNLFLMGLFCLVPVMTALYPISRLLQKCSYLLTLTPSEWATKLSHQIEGMAPEKKQEFSQAVHIMLEEAHKLLGENERLSDPKVPESEQGDNENLIPNRGDGGKIAHKSK
jgi:hypothetical protein